MTDRVSQAIRAHLTPRLQALYREFDAACDALDWDRADALMVRIQDASAAPFDYAFPEIQSNRIH